MKKGALMWVLAVAIVVAAVAGYKIWQAKKEPIQQEQVAAGYGKITGIFYSDDNPSAIVEGEVVYQGDMIRGVKVVKIHRDRVEFEKNGKVWSQWVQEEPKPNWSGAK